MLKAKFDLRRTISLAIIVSTVIACAFAAPGVARTVGQAAGSLNVWAIVVVCALQCVTWLIHAFALRVLVIDLALWPCLISRWVRDAVTNLLPVAPGMGELAGIRVISGQGRSPELIVSATAVDVAAETLAQVPYALLGLVLAPAVVSRLGWRGIHWGPVLLWLIPGLVVATLAAGWALGRWGGRFAAWRREHLAELRLKGFPASTGLHLAGWLMGGLQLWLGSHLLGTGLTLQQAVTVDSLIYAGRALFFFIPAGIGIQEIGFVSIGALMHIPAAEALAFALLLRARDAISGAPALVVWLVVERGRRKREAALPAAT